jgi:hypothetical protein
VGFWWPWDRFSTGFFGLPMPVSLHAAPLLYTFTMYNLGGRTTGRSLPSSTQTVHPIAAIKKHDANNLKHWMSPTTDFLQMYVKAGVYKTNQPRTWKNKCAIPEKNYDTESAVMIAFNVAYRLRDGIILHGVNTSWNERT